LIFYRLQIELCLRGIFAKAEVLPFGSSVNSFGKNNSDLDMIVVFDSNGQRQVTSRHPHLSLTLSFPPSEVFTQSDRLPCRHSPAGRPDEFVEKKSLKMWPNPFVSKLIHNLYLEKQ
jgi:hypothetical protein